MTAKSLSIGSTQTKTCKPHAFTAPFKDMRTLKFKAQPTNVFIATVNQMFGGSSQLAPPDYCRALFLVITARWAEGGAAEYLIDGSKNAFVG